MFEDTTANILNNKYEFSTKFTSGRMSHWINNFSIKDNRNNEVILDLINTSWDLEGKVEEGDLLILSIRRYPDGHISFKVKFDLDKRVFEYENEEYPLASFKTVMRTKEGRKG